MTVTDLKPGDAFKIGNQRAYRIYKDSVMLKGELVPDVHKGKLLVILDDCRQMILDPTTEVKSIINHQS